MSKNLIVYLDRANKAKMKIKKNNQTIPEGVATKVSLDIPDNSFVSGSSPEVSTDTSYMSLISNDTEVELDLSGLDLKVGRHPARVTVYDVSTTVGYAWDSIIIEVSNWDI